MEFLELALAPPDEVNLGGGGTTSILVLGELVQLLNEVRSLLFNSLCLVASLRFRLTRSKLSTVERDCFSSVFSLLLALSKSARTFFSHSRPSSSSFKVDLSLPLTLSP